MPSTVKIVPTVGDDRTTRKAKDKEQGHQPADTSAKPFQALADLHTHMASQAQSVLGMVAKKDFTLSAARLFFTTYYLVTVPLRLSFFASYTYGPGPPIALTLPDCIADCFFIVQLLRRLRSAEARMTPGQDGAGGDDLSLKLSDTDGHSGDRVTMKQPQKTEINMTAVRGVLLFKHNLEVKKKYAVPAALRGPVAAPVERPSLWQALTTRKYRGWRHRAAWLLYEAMATLPLEAFAASVGVHRIGPFMVNRLLRITFLHQEMQRVIRYMEDQRILTNVMVQRMWQLIFVTVMCGHWGACCFFAIGKRDTRAGLNPTWLIVDGLANPLTSGATAIDWRSGRFKCYCRSLYWAVDTLITTGFGNIAPLTLHETVICIVFIYICIFTAAAAVSNLTLLVTAADHARTEFQLKMDAINKYMVYRRLPLALKQRITSFFEYRWQMLKGMDERRFQEELPPSLHQQVTNFLTRDHLKSLPLLRSADTALLNALSVHVDSYVYSPNDEIIKPGDPITSALLVSRGELEVVTSSGTVEAKLAAGDHYGAECLVGPASSKSLVRAKTFLEVFVLPAAAFKAVCMRHGGRELFEEFRSKLEATARSRDKASKLVGGGNAADELISQFRGFRRLRVPDSSFRRAWDVALALCLFFYAVATPLHLFWVVADRSFRGQAWLLVPGYLADVFFLADIVLRGRFFFYFEEGLLVYEPERIWQRFASERGIVKEAIGAIPLDLAACWLGPGWLSLLRLPKALRLSQMLPAFDRAQRVLLSSEKAVGINTRRFFFLYLAMVLACHWVGCLWTLVGLAGPLLGYRRNWIETDQTGADSRIRFSDAGGTAGYLRAVYFALFTMSTEGYPDISDTNMLETDFITLALLGGGMLMPAVVGGLASLMANIQKASKEYRDKIGELRLSMERQKYPAGLRERVLHYYDYLWGRQGGVQEESILDELPAPLRRKVAMYVNGDTLRRVPFFACGDDRIYEYIVTILRPRIFLPRDVAVKHGEVGKEMFMIEAGTFAVQSPDLQLTYVTLGRGAYLGESCLLVAVPHSASVVARGYVDTFVLSKADFYDVTAAYPAWQEKILAALRAELAEKCAANSRTVANIMRSQKLRSHLDVTAEEVAAAVTASATKASPTQSPGGNGGGSSPGGRVGVTVVQVGRAGKASRIIESRAVAGSIALAETAARGLAGLLQRPKRMLRLRSGTMNHPDSAERSLWDLIVFAALVVNLMAIPWCLAFLPDAGGYVALWALDSIFWADMYLRANHFAFVGDGQLHADCDSISARYAGPGGRFRYDVLANLPYDILALSCLNSPRHVPTALAALRLPRLLHARWTAKLTASLGRAAQAIGIPATPVELAELLGAVMLISHWAGCGLYMVASLRHAGADCNGLERDVADPSDGLSMYGYCRWAFTWVHRQVTTGQLPPDGGRSMTLYIRAVNWAMPTLVTASIGDTPMANYAETLYVFLWILFGLTINAIIIGNVANRVANLDSKQAEYLTTADALKRYMNRHDAPMGTRARVNAYMALVLARHGGLLTREDAEFNDLPLTLRQLVCEHSRVRHLKQCPSFDFCSEEVIRGLAMGLQREVCAQGDTVVHSGEAGTDMFFVDVGSVHILSPDEQDVLATLTAGAFFGETALFFRTERSATVRAAEFCELFVLAKEVLDRELAYVDFPVEKMAEAFLALQGANRRRNDAVRANLLRSAEPTSKLHKLVVVAADSSKNRRLLTFLLPGSPFRFAWEALSAAFILYTAFMLPYRLAFDLKSLPLDDGGGAGTSPSGQHDDALLAVEWVGEAFFVVDIVLRFGLFPSTDAVGGVVTDRHEIRKRYRETWLWYDLAASFPYDVTVQMLGASKYMLAFSVPRLLRLRRLPGHLGQLDFYFTAFFRLSLSISVRLLAKVFGCYLLLNHWYGCIWFLIHRYERHRALTWATFDGLATFDPTTGRHNACDVGIGMCYARSVYFAINTLGTVGYGDQMPFSNLETLWEWVVVLTGACMVSSVVGAFTAFFQYLDTSGDSAFKVKMATISEYMAQRQLPPDLQHAVRVHHLHLWRKSKVLDEEALLEPLSVPLRMELRALVRERFVNYCPAIAGCSPAMRKRLCVALRPQVNTMHAQKPRLATKEMSNFLKHINNDHSPLNCLNCLATWK